jgi:hypothetical protein
MYRRAVIVCISVVTACATAEEVPTLAGGVNHDGGLQGGAGDSSAGAGGTVSGGSGATAGSAGSGGSLGGGAGGNGGASGTGGASAAGGSGTGGSGTGGSGTGGSGTGGSGTGGSGTGGSGTGGSGTGGSGTGGSGTGGSSTGGSGTGGTTGTAPDGNCSDATYGGRTYWFCTGNRNWDEARPRCQAIGGDLVSINDDGEQSFITATAGSGPWVIGINKKNASGGSTAGTWEWVDGTPAIGGYENWASGEPDSNDCGAMNSDGTWIDWTCSNDENWICEVPGS